MGPGGNKFRRFRMSDRLHTMNLEERTPGEPERGRHIASVWMALPRGFL